MKMDEMIINTLGSGDDKEKYYVYALCDNNHKPFYIGKGEGDRITQHENGQGTEKQRIEELLKNDQISREEYDCILNNMSGKFKRIGELGQNNVKKVIIKWGLTEEEAFAAESSLINLCKFMNIELTNIANGHASKKEKLCRAENKTKARTLEDFKRECAAETVKITNTNEHPKILFLKINNSYNSSMSDDDIYDSVRGFWRIGQDTIAKTEYVFAVYNSQVVGTYKVNKDSWKKIDVVDESDFHNKDSCTLNNAKLVKENSFEDYKDLPNKDKDTIKTEFFNGKEPTEKVYTNLKNKYYFTASKEQQNTATEYLHKYIEFENDYKTLKCRSNMIKSW